MYKQQMIGQLVIEAIRVVDAISIEEEYAKYKLPHTQNLIDL